MLRMVKGIIAAKGEGYAVLMTGGVGYKIAAAPQTIAALPGVGAEAALHTHLHVREDALELYGFLTEIELTLFERLNTISGIGPRSALAILSIASADRLIAAINEGKTELLTKASGVGRKTAERIVLELKGKLEAKGAARLVSLMESDVELEETLMSLGYSRQQARQAIGRIDPSVTGFKERLKAALRQSKAK